MDYETWKSLGIWKKLFLLTLGIVLGLAVSGGVAFGMAKPWSTAATTFELDA